MTLDILPYVAPYIASMVISAAIGLYAWQQRSVSGATPFAILAFGQTLWTLGFIFELISNDLATKLFWDSFQFIGVLIWPLAFLAFALEYTDRQLPYPRTTWTILIGAGFILTVLLPSTNSWHHLARDNIHLLPGEPFNALRYDFGPVFPLFTFFLVAAMIYGFYLLIAQLFDAFTIYRRQILLIVVGNLIPLVASLLTVFGVTLSFQRDTAPTTFALGNVLIAWGVFRYRLFDLRPVARDLVVENTSDFVLVTDGKGRVVDLNPAASQLIGRPANQLVGQPIEAILRKGSLLLLLFKSDEKISQEIDVTIDGQPHIFDVVVSTIYDKRGTARGRLAVGRDITSYKEAQAEIQQRTEKLARANEQLRVLSRVKDEFVSNVSHELKTPITTLKINQYLLRKYPENSEVYIGRLERETERLARTIDDLLRLSRLDQGREQFNMQQVDLNALLGQFVEDRLLLAQEKDITLRFEGLDDLPPIEADDGLISQVLSILLTNALNYTPEQGQITVRTLRRQTEKEDWIGFAVSDTGPGIPPAEHARLFTRFYRGQVGENSGVPGTGLGLSIAKKIVDRHQGEIEVDSQGIAGQGTTFRVWLPLALEVSAHSS